MRKSILKVAQRNSFWLSLLLHVLLIVYFLLSWHFQQKDKEQDLPNLTIPAYTYQEELPAAASAAQTAQKAVQSEPNGLLKPNPSQVSAAQTALSETKPASKPTEAINLVGNKEIKKPLLELIGKALARTLVYPKIALDFNLRGISYVGFNLQPDGTVQDVQLMKSSGKDVLDQAALSGVEAISPVNKVEQFLQEKKFMVVGIIFR